MITLNRPYQVKVNLNSHDEIDLYHNKLVDWYYSSRDALNAIYYSLYRERGSLRVAVSPLTCFVALYPIVNNGHVPIFVDINEQTFNIDDEKLVKLTNVDVVQLIYLGGNPIAVDKILPWARFNNIIIIEDCAQALGSTYKGVPVGEFGDFAVYSSVKNLYAVAGGFMLSKDKIHVDKLFEVHPLIYTYKHIKHWLESKTNANKYNIWNILYKQLLQISEQGALTGSKIHTLNESMLKVNKILLTKQDIIQSNRTLNANKLLMQIDKNKYFIQQEVEYAVSSRNRIMLLSKNRLAKDIINELRNIGIAANNLTQSYLFSYQENISNNKLLSRYYVNTLISYEKVLPQLLCIPSSPSLTDSEIEFIVNNVNKLG